MKQTTRQRTPRRKGHPSARATAGYRRQLDQVRQTLRESALAPHAAVPAGSERALLVEADGTILALNGPAARSLGKTVSQAVGLNAFDLTPKSLIKSRKAAIAAVLRTGRPVHHLDHRDGRWLHAHLYPVADREGKAARVALFTHDVTNLKRTAKLIQESEERDRLYFENVQDVICGIDAEFRITSISPSVERVLGYKPENLVGKSVTRILAPPYRAKALSRGRRILQGERTAAEEYEFIRRDGSRCVAELSASPVRDHGRTSILVVARDVTARKQAEKTLRETQERYRALVENVDLGIALVDRGHDVLMANAAMGRLFDRDPAGMVGRKCFARFKNAKATCADCPGKRAMARGLPAEREGARVRSDGARQYLRIRAFPLVTHGVSRQFIEVVEDVTEHRRSEEALQAARSRLAIARDEERRRLVSELHDSFSQGLVALQLSIRKALQNESGEMSADTAAALHGACEKCVALTSELRGICRGLYPPTLESSGVAPALEQLAQDDSGQPRVRVECAGSVKSRRFSPDIEIAIYRIAQEALNNALRHSGASHIGIRLTCKPRCAVLTVRDDGKGFDASASAGPGIGLTTMRERAETAGGSFRIASRPGDTVVQACLPVAAHAAAIASGTSH